MFRHQKFPEWDTEQTCLYIILPALLLVYECSVRQVTVLVVGPLQQPPIPLIP